MTPNRLLTGATGCKECKGVRTKRCFKTNAKLLDAFRKVHGTRYDYSHITEVHLLKDRVSIVCPLHGSFQQQIFVHLDGRGCKKCALSEGNRRYTTESFMRDSKAKFGERWDYSEAVYTGGHASVTIICPEHGKFQQETQQHLKGSVGCKECARQEAMHTTGYFVANASLVHEGKYDYTKVRYSGCNERVVITCPRHGDFEQRASGHLAGNGCPNCFKRLSRMSMEWIQYMETRLGTTIKHGDNDGEFILPESGRWKADGYIAASNTVLEFHGTYWHGHPSVYQQDVVHPQDRQGRTYGTLYNNTLSREETIRGWGYDLIVMWEHDWKRGVAAVIVLQKMWRARRHLRSITSYKLKDVWPSVN